MNKVSWRRILQRAGHEYPDDGGEAVVQIGESPWGGRSGYNAPFPQHAESGMLESELKRALDRATRRGDQPKAAVTPPGWDPIFMAGEIGGNALTTRVEVPSRKRAGSGGRNILAISLSAAVVGLAFQQISAQWNESRAGGTGIRVVPAATTNPASLLYAGTATRDAQSGYGVQPSRNAPQSLQLRASVSDPTPPAGIGEAKVPDVFLTDIEQASSVLATSPQRVETSQAHVTPVSAPIKAAAARDPEAAAISGVEEQSMLRRARELMERGHVSGARLIFEHLALRQSALGAFALAQTYDEKFLKGFFVKGLEADQKLAAKWYRRAAELGTQFADKR
jgi:hypothetical protein